MDKNSILIVVDMQNDFIDGVLGSEDAQAIVPTVRNIIENFDGYHIYATTDWHPIQEVYNICIEGQMIPAHCFASPGVDIENSIQEALQGRYLGTPNAVTRGVNQIKKTSFGSLVLADLLREEIESREINTIYIVGLCTDICVISNALMIRAACPTAHIVVFENACAGSTPEAHEAAIKVMESNCIEIQYYVNIQRNS